MCACSLTQSHATSHTRTHIVTCTYTLPHTRAHIITRSAHRHTCVCALPHTCINTVTTVCTHHHTRVYTASPVDTQIYCVGTNATRHVHPTTRVDTSPHRYEVRTRTAPGSRHTATHSHLVRGAQHAQGCASTQMPRSPGGAPQRRGGHKPTWDAGPWQTHTGCSRTRACGLFCSRCPGEPRPRPPGVPHCPLPSPPGRGRLPGRLGCQQGRLVGQVSAGSVSTSGLLQQIPRVGVRRRDHLQGLLTTRRRGQAGEAWPCQPRSLAGDGSGPLVSCTRVTPTWLGQAPSSAWRQSLPVLRPLSFLLSTPSLAALSGPKLRPI